MLNRSNETNSKGFKPVISIPNSNAHFPPSSPTSQETNLSTQSKLHVKYQQYLKLVKEHQLIKTTIEHVNREKAELKQKYSTLHTQLQQQQSIEKQSVEEKHKRHRRNANEIVRNCECPLKNCGKSYGTEASLTQHIKLKHQSYFKSAEFRSFMEDTQKKNSQQNCQNSDVGEGKRINCSKMKQENGDSNSEVDDSSEKPKKKNKQVRSD